MLRRTYMITTTLPQVSNITHIFAVFVTNLLRNGWTKSTVLIKTLPSPAFNGRQPVIYQKAGLRTNQILGFIKVTIYKDLPSYNDSVAILFPYFYQHYCDNIRSKVEETFYFNQSLPKPSKGI